MAKFILMNTTNETPGIFTSRHDSQHSEVSKEAFIEIFEKETSSTLTEEERDEICVHSDSADLGLEDEDGYVTEFFSLELI